MIFFGEKTFAFGKISSVKKNYFCFANLKFPKVTLVKMTKERVKRESFCPQRIDKLTGIMVNCILKV